MSNQKLMDIYNRMLDRFGPQYWWPGETTIEIIVGAILTQNTNWGNVEKAINNLKNANLLCPEKLHNMSADVLAELIRPAGYFNIKAQRLKSFLNWLFEKHDGDLKMAANLGNQTLREELLKIKGIGPETADSICLYAFNRPIFVVDAYTARILGRHGFLEPDTNYHQIQELFEYNLESDVQLFNEYHALLVKLGKEHCKKRPVCTGCPLEDLPHQIEEF